MKWMSVFGAWCLALGLTVSVAATAADDSVKVVYHMSEGVPQASRAINNIRNHLSADPDVKIVVVAHGLGIDFLLKDAMNQMEQPFGPAIADLAGKGVEFRVCNNTLVARKLDASNVIAQAKVVPSGVAETANLQAKQGFVYLRP
jgi:uncharacterized protein